jgi:uncharacterized membrane protein YeaQ/YmgE (transglycosylase-associated protein family)
MNFDAFAIAILLLLWSGIGVLPWLVLAVVHHGQDVLLTLPLSIVGGILGGLSVPALGFTDERSLLVSMLFAFLGGLLFTIVVVYWGHSTLKKLR